MHAKRFQQGLGRLKPLCWVMISCRHHDLQLGIYTQKTGDGGIEQSLRFARWIDAVKHIACDKEHVNALGHNHITYRFKKGPVLILARPTVQGLADVPVSSVQDTHRVFLGLF
ncbi:hypothetical protein BA011_29890 (plasmid) [Rhizobium leguminosarum]|uniref:Uncharacterized protein n=1 Tax=Rhizobium leguminosarum TaxID=384 RepID=A0A1B1CJG5_RHILE|nr:hypothetical protein BA011_29890 [Rhizobium leguminosarum]